MDSTCPWNISDDDVLVLPLKYGVSSSTMAVGYRLTIPSISIHNSYDPVICSGLTSDFLTTHVVDPVSLITMVFVPLKRQEEEKKRAFELEKLKIEAGKESERMKFEAEAERAKIEAENWRFISSTFSFSLSTLILSSFSHCFRSSPV